MWKFVVHSGTNLWDTGGPYRLQHVGETVERSVENVGRASAKHWKTSTYMRAEAFGFSEVRSGYSTLRLTEVGARGSYQVAMSCESSMLCTEEIGRHFRSWPTRSKSGPMIPAWEIRTKLDGSHQRWCPPGALASVCGGSWFTIRNGDAVRSSVRPKRSTARSLELSLALTGQRE